MRNRVITVPKNKNAEKLLDYDANVSGQLIELNIDEEDFLFLLNEEIITLINLLGKTNIDDYEDDYIEDKKLKKLVISELEKIKFDFDKKNRELIENLIRLFKEAVSRETGVYFFF